MNLKQLMKGSGLAALAAALAMTALPTQASAQGRPSWNDGNNNRTAARVERRTERQAARTERQANRQAERTQRVERRAESRPAPVRRAEPRRIEQVRTPPSRAQQRRPQPSVAQRQAPQAAPRNRGEQFREAARNRTYANNDRNRSYDGRRDRGDRRDNDRNWNGRRDNDRDWRSRDRRDYRDGRRDGYRDGRSDHRRWDRRWRNSDRYNWHNYRRHNRNTFNLGIYYSPYRHWSYRRLSIGFFLDSLFYSNRYWIDDPYRYRLPQVYGPYRWVRYYDDVLLVDIYSGEVVDVIYDFFW